MELSVRDVERLENTSFASAFASTAEAAGSAEASGVCIISVGCQATYACSNDCVVVETLDEVTGAVTQTVQGSDAVCSIVCHTGYNCGLGEAALLDAARGA